MKSVPLSLITLFCASLLVSLSGCGSISNVRSFSTPYSLPASDQTARLRVFSDGMVRAIPKSACVDFRLPGAGVLVAPRKGYADRNNESLGMPAIVSQPAGTVRSEFKIPAGEPVSFVYNRERCYNRFTFVPQPGADYELDASGYSNCTVSVRQLPTGSKPGKPLALDDSKMCRLADNY
ncbi:hypothetical protein [Pseudomonas shirazensis]|uniref:hypothetical protein n=1 Tax=Pseudomonas shirazensis TaxID=2745494 RepID=UPI003D2C6B84